jgi:hypothetical protein
MEFADLTEFQLTANAVFQLTANAVLKQSKSSREPTAFQKLLFGRHRLWKSSTTLSGRA